MSLFTNDMFGRTCLKTQSRSIIGGITEVTYPENIDAVIYVDTLPHILPSKPKATMDKIFLAFVPGGKFMGTLFFHNNKKS